MSTVGSNARETGIRKAAIFVASLDSCAADLLLDQLGPERADLVREAAMGLDAIDDQQRQRIIDEFRRIGPMVPDESPPGIELDGLMPEQLTPSEWDECVAVNFGTNHIERPGTAVPGNEEPIDDATEASPPFGFLREAEEEKLWQLLSTERPQTIALVLSHLPPERAGDVLSRFAPALTAEVVRRLVDLENTDPETLRQVEQALEARLSRQFDVGGGRTTGPEAVARILASCDTGVAGEILDNLAQFDQSLAEQLGRRPPEFDDLVGFDDVALSAIFQAAAPAVAEAALLGAPPELIERVLRGMAAEEAAMLRRKLNCPAPIRLSDLEEARRQIAALAQRMSCDSTRKTNLAA